MVLMVLLLILSLYLCQTSVIVGVGIFGVMGVVDDVIAIVTEPTTLTTETPIP